MSRWALTLLAFSLAGCSKTAITDWAENTRDRVATSVVTARNTASFERPPLEAEDYMIARRPRAAALVTQEEAKAPAGDTLYAEPTSPFAPMVEPQAPVAPPAK